MLSWNSAVHNCVSWLLCYSCRYQLPTLLWLPVILIAAGENGWNNSSENSSWVWRGEKSRSGLSDNCLIVPNSSKLAIYWSVCWVVGWLVGFVFTSLTLVSVILYFQELWQLLNIIIHSKMHPKHISSSVSSLEAHTLKTNWSLWGNPMRLYMKPAVWNLSTESLSGCLWTQYCQQGCLWPVRKGTLWERYGWGWV